MCSLNPWRVYILFSYSLTELGSMKFSYTDAQQIVASEQQNV